MSYHIYLRSVFRIVMSAIINDVRFIFDSSCLDGSCLIYVSCVCLRILTIRVTWRVSCGRQGLLAIRGHLGSPLLSGRVRVAHLLSLNIVFFVLFVFALYVLHPMLPVSLD